MKVSLINSLDQVMAFSLSYIIKSTNSLRFRQRNCVSSRANRNVVHDDQLLTSVCVKRLYLQIALDDG